jgi:hypothetical protein
MLYTHEAIAECEQLTGKPFPEDFKSYLLHTGWAKLAYDHRSIPVPNGEYIYTLQFEGVEHQTFSLHRYKQYLEKNTSELPYNTKYYYPFGKIEGEINPAVSYQLLINLNEEEYGSIWAFPSLKIADSFTLFLQQIGANDTLKRIASLNNEQLFDRLLTHCLVTSDITPTSAADPAALLNILFEQQQPVIVNGVRNVEFQHYDNSLRMENAHTFTERANAFAKLVSIPALQRRDIKINTPEPLDRSYYLVKVDSMVGNNYPLKETFLLHYDVKWTLLSRRQATIEDVKIKGVGTFTFDSTYKWELSKKITPAWGELKASLHVEGEEDALTADRITFIKEVLAKADFKPVLEAYIIRLTELTDIWSVLGKDFNIYIDSDNEFHLHTDCPWDEEHGITVRVKNWQIQ